MVVLLWKTNNPVSHFSLPLSGLLQHVCLVDLRVVSVSLSGSKTEEGTGLTPEKEIWPKELFAPPNAARFKTFLE